MYITDARMNACAQLHPGHLREPCLLEHVSQRELEGMKKHACGCGWKSVLDGVPVHACTCYRVPVLYTVRYISAGVARQDSLTVLPVH